MKLKVCCQSTDIKVEERVMNLFLFIRNVVTKILISAGSVGGALAFHCGLSASFCCSGASPEGA
jgi:hypothetical protein